MKERPTGSVRAAIIAACGLLLPAAVSCGWFESWPLLPGDAGAEDPPAEPSLDRDLSIEEGAPHELSDPAEEGFEGETFVDRIDPAGDFPPDPVPGDATDPTDTPADVPVDIVLDTAADLPVDDAADAPPDACHSPPERSCDDGLDEDCDGLTDCDDVGDCIGTPACCTDLACNDYCVSTGHAMGICTCVTSACTCGPEFADDFTHTGRWFVDDTPECLYDYDGDEYIIVTFEDFYLCWAYVPGSPVYTDATVQVDCEIESHYESDACGVLMRYAGDDFYLFEVNAVGDFRVALQTADHWLFFVDWTHSPAIHPGGDVNRLRVTARGNRFDFCVNGAPLHTLTDSALSSGEIALVTDKDGSSDRETVAWFDNFAIFLE